MEHADLQDWELLKSPDVNILDVHQDYFLVGPGGRDQERGRGEVGSDENGESPKENLVGLGRGDGGGVWKEVEVEGEDGERSEETDKGGSVVVEAAEEPNDETDVIGIIEEIEANTDSAEWGLVRSADTVPTPERTEEVEVKSGGEGSGSVGKENRSEVAWWKFPLDLVKFCVFNVKPVWTVSVAAAMVGFAIIGQRWYHARRRRRTIAVGLGINDKASQRVARASRLNEAFFLVKRVPLWKTTISTNGISPWPAMALR